jgi:hypothetical protein
MTTGLLTLLLTLGVGGNPPDVYTMRNSNLEIPIRVNEAKRADIKELELHVSSDQGRTWTLAGRAMPDQKAFAFHANGDGLYWFCVCAIDKTGRREPEDIATAKPALKVMIDTTHPALQVVAIDRVGEEVQVAWECNDSQADPASLRLEYRPAGAEPTAVWTPAAVPPQLIGTCRFRPTQGGALAIRMQIVDGTGSPATVVKDVPAGALAVAAAPPPSAPAFPPTPAPMMSAPVMQPPQPQPQPAAPPAGIQQTTNSSPPPVMPVAPLGQTPAMVNPQAPAPAPLEPPAISAAPPPAPAPMTESSAAPPGLAPLKSAGEPTPRPATAPAASDLGGAAEHPHVQSAEVLHVRDKTVGINFAVDRIGPSGIKKIEVYCTQDDGQTWGKYSETLITSPPLQLDMPAKDGLYGFCMVLTSGVGQSEGPPRSGEPPHFRVLVDRTLPQVMLFEPSLDPNDPKSLILRFKAADANLIPGSVALYWRARLDQPWQPLVAGPPHASPQFAGVQECSWVVPEEIRNSVYLRVTAKDQAGNVGEFVTRDPVTVDLNKPVARFLGVTSVSYHRP